MAFEISDGQLKAELISLTIASNEGLVSVPDLKTVLADEAGICYGVDDDALTAVLDGVAKGIFEKRTVIARGKTATPGIDGQVNYPYLKKLKNSETAHGDVIGSLAFSDIEQFAVPDGLRTLLVTPGQDMVEITEATEGEEGMTVGGDPIQCPGISAKNAPKPGEGLVVDKGTYQANIYGYPHLANGVLHVLSPAWVAPDFMSAAFVQLPLHHPCAQPQSDWIMELLAAAGVVHGISEPEIERLCREPSAIEARIVVLASGLAVVHGEDAHFEPAFDMAHRPGRVLEGGAIEFRDRNKGVAVEAGDRLGFVSLATTGVDGMDVRGQKLPATNGKPLEFSNGEGVRVASTKEADALAAAAAGEADPAVEDATEELEENG
ncbi:MAG: flagellar assembly protein A [Candidatus Latescibacterota bacterium]